MKQCCNPTGIQRHSTSKTAKKAKPATLSQIHFMKNNPAYSAAIASVVGKLQLCHQCSKAMYEEMKRGIVTPEPTAPVMELGVSANPQPSGRENEKESSSKGSCESEKQIKEREAASGSSDEFNPKEDRNEKIDDTLLAVGVSPLKKRSRLSEMKREVGRKWNRASVNLAKKFRKATGSPSGISPTKSNVSPKAITKKCSQCDKLINSLLQAFQKVSTKQDKYRILTCVPDSVTIAEMRQSFNCSVFMARNARSIAHKEGAFSAPPLRAGRKLDMKIVNVVKEFYRNTDNSRVDPARRATVLIYNPHTQKKEPQPKQYILMTLSQLYNEYKTFYGGLEEAKVSLSHFAKLRPRNCIFPGKRGYHVTCTCIIHENFKLLMSACNIIKFKTGSLLEPIVCSVDSETCMLGTCKVCPKQEGVSGLWKQLEEDMADEEMVDYYKWMQTDGTELVRQSAFPEEFKELVKSSIPVIMQHHFINEQKKFIANRKAALNDENAIMISVDFGENYTFLVQYEVQGFHWNNAQATIHPFVVSFYCPNSKKVIDRFYTVISNEMEHSASTFHIFRSELIKKYIKRDLEAGTIPQFKKIVYVSDGAASQYKNYKNFINLAFHELDFKLTAEWHFSATAHGKSVCDGMSAIAKRSTRLESLKNNVVITTPLQMFMFLQREKKENQDYIYVDKDEIVEMKQQLEERYKDVKSIKGTRSFHSYIPVSQTEIAARKYSSALLFQVFKLKDSPEDPVDEFVEFQVGHHVAFMRTNSWHLGIVTKDDVDESGELCVNFMKRSGKANSFTWGDPPKEDWVHVTDLLCVTEVPDTTTGRVYKFRPAEFERIHSMFATKQKNTKGG